VEVTLTVAATVTEVAQGVASLEEAVPSLIVVVSVVAEEAGVSTTSITMGIRPSAGTITAVQAEEEVEIGTGQHHGAGLHLVVLAVGAEDRVLASLPHPLLPRREKPRQLQRRALLLRQLRPLPLR
jgi:hypothetical protein